KDVFCTRGEVETMNTEDKESETVVIRDSVNGNKLYEIVKLNGEALIFDYVASSKRKVEASKVYEWLRQDGFSVVMGGEKWDLFFREIGPRMG
ncbi:MAG: hypothetical protein ACM3SR_11175, partial [Ignavibacteriales bacterium]